LSIQVSLKWIAQQGIPVIPKTDKKEHMLENVALFDWTLNDEDMAALTKATTPAVAGNAGPPPTSGDCDIL
jgi:diketogulonate reductase-like aldo/keto reductase